MLCPSCRTTSTKKEREGGKCPTCGRAFRIETPNPLSDADMEAVIRKLSQKGRHKFTFPQLAAEAERFIVRRELAGIDQRIATLTPNTAKPWIYGSVSFGIAGLLGWLTSTVAEDAVGIVVPFVLFGIVCFVYGTRRSDPVEERARLASTRPAHDARGTSIAESYAAAGPVGGLLPPPRIERSPVAERREFDLESFGFDRVVVVESSELVDMLVANRFHFEHNAAVVSFDGYPAHVADLVRRQMAGGTVRASVFLLHSATAEGYTLAERWRASAWAKTSTLVHVGLTAAQTARVLPVASRATAAFPASLSATEAAAIRARPVALAALRPVQIMTLLFNAIHHVESAPPGASDEPGVGVFLFASAAETVYDFG